MRFDHAKLKSFVYESPHSRLRLDVKIEELGQGSLLSWFWIQIEDRDKNAYLEYFLPSEEALHLACTIIQNYAGNLSKTGDIDHLKAWAQAIIEKIEDGKRGDEE
jgi:hypothetical protein